MDLVTKENFIEVLYQGGLDMLPDDNQEHFAMLRVLSEFMILAEREELYRMRIMNIQQDFLNGFRDLLLKGLELGLVPSRNVDYKAHMLALVIDNISRCMMMNFTMDYEEVWKEAVNSVLIRDVSAD